MSRNAVRMKIRGMDSSTIEVHSKHSDGIRSAFRLIPIAFVFSVTGALDSLLL